MYLLCLKLSDCSNLFEYRSYYRCTSASCGVKKRVERLTEDPAVVVTTYEGIHIHPCPVTPRGMLPETATYGGLGGGGGSSYILPPFHYQQPLRPFFHNQTNSLSFNNTTTPSSYSHYLQERQFCPPSMTSSLHRDQGLLQDMVSFQIRKEEPKVEPSWGYFGTDDYSVSLEVGWGAFR